MIETFKIIISYNDRKYLYKLINLYKDKDISFNIFLRKCEEVLKIGFSYFLALKLGCSYKQLYSIAYNYCPISKQLESRIFDMIINFIENNNNISVSFYVQEFDKQTLAYVYSDRGF